MKKIRVGVVGSRCRIDRSSVEALVNACPPNTVIVSGGCRGVDTWAAEAARAKGLEVREFLPQWPNPRPYQKFEVCKIYYARNRQIAENSDVLCAFVAPIRKGGTENTVEHAQGLGVPVVIC